jgi:hypothetical protein
LDFALLISFEPVVDNGHWYMDLWLFNLGSDKGQRVQKQLVGGKCTIQVSEERAKIR